jgi:hypothetical protein
MSMSRDSRQSRCRGFSNLIPESTEPGYGTMGCCIKRNMNPTRLYACIFVHDGDKLGSSRWQGGLRFRIDQGFRRLTYGAPDGELVEESHHLCFITSITHVKSIHKKIKWLPPRVFGRTGRRLYVSFLPASEVDV